MTREEFIKIIENLGYIDYGFWGEWHNLGIEGDTAVITVCTDFAILDNDFEFKYDDVESFNEVSSSLIMRDGAEYWIRNE